MLKARAKIRIGAGAPVYLAAVLEYLVHALPPFSQLYPCLQLTQSLTLCVCVCMCVCMYACVRV